MIALLLRRTVRRWWTALKPGYERLFTADEWLHSHEWTYRVPGMARVQLWLCQSVEDMQDAEYERWKREWLSAYNLSNMR